MRVSFAVAIALAISFSTQVRAASYQYKSFLSITGAPTNYGVFPASINNRGEIVGTIESATGPSTGFIFAGGKTVIVNVPGASDGTMLKGINNAAIAVGSASSNLWNVGFTDAKGQLQSLTLKDGAPADLTGINNRQQVVASIVVNKTQDGAILHLAADMTVDRATILAVPGATQTAPSSINDHGQIVGTYIDSVGAHGFLYTDGLFATIDAPNAVPGKTFANGINNRGEIVGRYVDTMQNNHGFLLRQGKYIVIEFPGSEGATSANGINDNGVVTGNYYIPAGETAAAQTAGFVAIPQS